MKNAQKGSALTVTLVLIIVLAGSAFWAYRIFWIDYYKGDLEKLAEGSGAEISGVDCKRVGFKYRLKCEFESSDADIVKIIDYFGLELHKIDDTGYPNLFTNQAGDVVSVGDLSSCDYYSKAENGAELFGGAWSPAVSGARNNLYSGANLIIEPYTAKACIILDITHR